MQTYGHPGYNANLTQLERKSVASYNATHVSSQLQSQQQQQQHHTGPGTSGNSSVWNKFEKGDKIGEGTYGWVYHARSKETGGRFAIKQFKGGREFDGISPTAIREIMLLRELNHDNIVRLDSVHINRAEPSLWLAFDYADHDLYEMIKFHRDNRDNRRDNPYGVMPHHIVRSVMYQLLNGLSYMHQHWIIHRDLKPSNVLVMGEDAGSEQYGHVKIADFGLARIFQSPLRPLSDNGVVVTIWYRAPELLLGAKHYTRAVDVWAAGCIFAELCMLKPLFQGQEKKQQGNPFQSDQLDKVFRVLGHPNPKAWPDLEHLHHWHDNTDNVRVKRPEYGSNQLESTVLEAMKQALPAWAIGNLPSECRPNAEAFKLLNRMLDYNPNTRITAEEALQHPYFTNEPWPSANAFFAPAGREPLVRYPVRAMSHPFTAPLDGQQQQQPAHQAQQQAGGRMSQLAAGMLASRPPSGAAAAGGGRKRKSETLPGFR